MMVDEHKDIKQKIIQTSFLNYEDDDEMMDSDSVEMTSSNATNTLIEKTNNFKNFNPIEISNNIKIYFEPLLAKKFF